MALPLLLASVAQIADVVREIPPAAWSLVNRFLPGALTLVLPASASVPDIITAGSGGVAVRIPAHPVPIALIRGISAPLVGTSANVSGQPSPLTAEEVRGQLGGAVDLIIDDGQRCPGRESTIVDLTGEVPVVLREGAIPIEALRRVAGNVTVKEGD
jgi:L-threonylcarbamoyladenylate synthase